MWRCRQPSVRDSRHAAPSARRRHGHAATRRVPAHELRTAFSGPEDCNVSHVGGSGRGYGGVERQAFVRPALVPPQQRDTFTTAAVHEHLFHKLLPGGERGPPAHKASGRFSAAGRQLAPPPLYWMGPRSGAAVCSVPLSAFWGRRSSCKKRRSPAYHRLGAESMIQADGPARPCRPWYRRRDEIETVTLWILTLGQLPWSYCRASGYYMATCITQHQLRKNEAT